MKGQLKPKSGISRGTRYKHTLDLLRAYTGDDDTLMEMLNFMLSENQKELEKLGQALENADTLQCADIIHKLSSRFAQLGIQPPADPRQTELDLRNKKARSTYPAKTLFKYWNSCNAFLTEKYSGQTK